MTQSSVARSAVHSLAHVLFLVLAFLPFDAKAQDHVNTRNGVIEMLSVQPSLQKSDSDLAATYHRFARLTRHADSYHLVLRFADILTSIQRTALSSHGVDLESYLPGNVYIARVSSDMELKDLQSYGLSAVGRLEVTHKVADDFRVYLSTANENQLLVRSSYSSGLAGDEVVRALSSQLGIAEITVYEHGGYFTALMTPDSIPRVASLPFIRAIEPHAEPSVEQGSLRSPDYDENIVADVQATHIRANVIKSTLPERLGLTGNGVVAGLGDAVYQGQTHIDLRGRHSVLDPGLGNNGTFSQHGNHTTSILAGAGTARPRFEGVAPAATVYTMRTGDYFQLGLEQPSPMVISSNSWNSSDPVYSDWYEQKGRYNVQSQSIDLLLRNEKQLLSLFSAGNSGGTQTGYPDNYLTLNPSYGSAKNTLVVGRHGHPVWTSLASSYGPARDGRIKPDVVAQNNVHSAIAFNDYATYQGSSQSTPAVSGAAALLVEHYRNINGGATPDGALIKAVLMNTADYVLVDGPTFASGYGLVNARRAAEVITASQTQSSEVENGAQVDISIPIPEQVDGKSISRVKVMLYWTDKEASPYASSALVNNLDLVVIDGAESHLPWVLDTTPSNVNLPASVGVDSLNNVEQVVIDLPASGTMTARVSGTTIPFGPQEFHVVYSYVLDELVVTHPMGGEKFFGGQNKVVFWDSPYVSGLTDVDDVAYSLDGMSTWTSFHGNSGSVRAASIFPVPQAALGEAYVRVTRSGESAIGGPFVVSERIEVSMDAAGSGGPRVEWNAVLGAESYELLALSAENDWRVVHTTTDTSTAWDASYGTGRESWISVRAVDGSGLIKSQRADAIQYVSTNSDPVAEPDALTISTGGRASLQPLANDSDGDGDTMFITGLSEASHGAATLRDDQSVQYYPDSGFSGTDSFEYTVSDGMGGIATGTVTISVVSGVATEEESAIPESFSLGQNYPNPFNPRTTIRFALPVSSEVELVVFDALGRRVQTLINDHMPAGWHQVGFDASRLASGAYFYRIQTPLYTRTQSMLLFR